MGKNKDSTTKDGSAVRSSSKKTAGSTLRRKMGLARKGARSTAADVVSDGPPPKDDAPVNASAAPEVLDEAPDGKRLERTVTAFFSMPTVLPKSMSRQVSVRFANMAWAADPKVSQFIDATNAPYDTAEKWVKFCDGDVRAAVVSYRELGGGERPDILPPPFRDEKSQTPRSANAATSPTDERFHFSAKEDAAARRRWEKRRQRKAELERAKNGGDLDGSSGGGGGGDKDADTTPTPTAADSDDDSSDSDSDSERLDLLDLPVDILAYLYHTMVDMNLMGACANLAASCSLLASLFAEEVVQRVVRARMRDRLQTHLFNVLHRRHGNNRVNSLDQLRALRDLKLTRFPLRSLVPVLTLTDLRTLRLQDNGLRKVPFAICELYRLRELTVANQPLDAIDSGIGLVTRLEVLRIADCTGHMVSLPPSLCKLVRLHTLELQNCGLAGLPYGLGALTGLTRLDVSSNLLHSLPEDQVDAQRDGDGDETDAGDANDSETDAGDANDSETDAGDANHSSNNNNNNNNKRTHFGLGSLAKLEVLRCSGNELTSIPHSVSRLTHLRKLKMHSNKIERVSAATLEPLDQLTKLSLHNNAITVIEPGAMAAAALRTRTTVELDGNQLTEVPADVRLCCGTLRELSMSHNLVAALPPWFGELALIRRIDLSHNQLVELPSAAFEQLARLRHLDVSYNRLVALPLGSHMKHLETVDASHNSLVDIPSGVMVELLRQKLRRIDVSHNPTSMRDSARRVRKRSLKLARKVGGDYDFDMDGSSDEDGGDDEA